MSKLHGGWSAQGTRTKSHEGINGLCRLYTCVGSWGVPIHWVWLMSFNIFQNIFQGLQSFQPGRWQAAHLCLWARIAMVCDTPTCLLVTIVWSAINSLLRGEHIPLSCLNHFSFIRSSSAEAGGSAAHLLTISRVVRTTEWSCKILLADHLSLLP